MRYPISADRLELMTKLLVVAYHVERDNDRRKAMRPQQRPKRTTGPHPVACGT